MNFVINIMASDQILWPLIIILWPLTQYYGLWSNIIAFDPIYGLCFSIMASDMIMASYPILWTLIQNYGLWSIIMAFDNNIMASDPI